MLRLLPKDLKVKQRSKLENVTIRGFGGGWNAVDDDLSMQVRFQKELINLRRTTSASQKIRFGTNWFCDLRGVVTGDILDMEYFSGRMVIVMTSGQIATCNDLGVTAAIWNTVIASGLPGAPTGWSGSLTQIDFVPFKNELVIHNGVDKPITISASFAATYLQDLATGSNVNVPIGKYGCTSSNYHCVSGIPATPTVIFISNSGTAGTFPGDPPANDAISIDVGAYAPEGAAEIRGISGFRSYLIVHFLGQSLVVTLGVYTDTGVHRPEFPDTLPKFGLLGHRCVITLENDLVFAGLNGVFSAKRNLFSGQINSAPLSALIDPEYTGTIDLLTEVEQQQQCFAILDPIAHDVLTFTKTGRVFVYSANEQLKYKAWSEFDYGAEPWICGCTSFLGRVFLARGTKVFQMGNTAFTNEEYNADHMNDRDSNWTPGTVYAIGDLVRDTVGNKSYTAAVTHTSAAGTFEEDFEAREDYWEEYLGDEISFTLETPWLDGKDPMKTKQNRFVRVGTRGSAEFTIDAYADDLCRDDTGEIVYDPGLSMTFIGNQAKGFGYEDGPFGGGRRSNVPRLYKFPLKFQMLKCRITGSTRKPLEIVTLSFLFARGRYKR